MNLELVEQIVGVFSEFPVSEIAVEFENARVYVRRPLAGIAVQQANVHEISASESAAALLDGTLEAEASTEEIDVSWVLTAPMVGIFYHAEPPLPLGLVIKPGQLVGSIESMKLMNDVAAEEGGQITDILVEDGAPVEYGQALFRLAAL